MMTRDAQGRPPEWVYSGRRTDRLITELLGMIRGVLFDGDVTELEALGVGKFIEENPEILDTFPANEVYRRIMHAAEDRRIDARERRSLQQLFELLESQAVGIERPLPAIFTDPLPPLYFDGARWVVTGEFAFGDRADVEQAIADRGGRVVSAVSGLTNFVLVGYFSSPAWIQGGFGRKIEDAMRLRDEEAASIAIVPESAWVEVIDLDR